MDNLTAFLKNIDRSKIDEALALLQSLRNDEPAQNGETTATKPADTSSSADAHPPKANSTNQSDAEQNPHEQAATASSEGVESPSVDDDDTPLAALGRVLSTDEKKAARDTQKAEKNAEREVRRKMREEENNLTKLEADNRKAIGEEEKDDRRSLRESERESRRATKEAEKETRRKAREEEQEAEKEQRQKARDAELEAKQKAREAEKEALKAPKEAPNSLAVFGFLSSAVKADNKKNKLFSNFVQDKRTVPAALQFWTHHEAKDNLNEEDASVIDVPVPEAYKGTYHDIESSRSRFVDEESSLLHPPMFVEPDVSSKREVCIRDFNSMIEASNTLKIQPRELLRECGCAFHVAAEEPYPSFDNEVIFSGFFAIGYDPCQSRPPYFGTYNHLQEGNLNEAELLQMARFAPGQEIPRLSNIDYDYDSGDDWDVMEGDEDIAASSSDESDKDSDLNSLDSSDLEFINDDDEEDSDCDIQRKIMEARQRRLFRLRNKDKLVPSYSGPFVGIPNDEHPLRNFDEMERIAPLTAVYFSELLENELSALASGNAVIPAVGDEDLSAEERDARLQRALMEAALKNRRDMTDHELKALHDLISANGRISTKMIIKALKEQQLCVGVAKAEIGRTIKRLYERRHGSLLLREKPWSPTDERLFTPAPAVKKPKSTDNGGSGKLAEEDDKDDADDENEEDHVAKEEKIEVMEPATDAASGNGALPPAPPQNDERVVHTAALTGTVVEAKEESVPKVKQMTLTEMLPRVGAVKDTKRPREDEQPGDRNGGVIASIDD
ncbi:hypothetical protein ABB37_08130 [Leptomonas pyrrhocoris]|uniref:Chromatin assembly factor 1 subunit A dimerization domain-containing protein n=1 Tax=Leptomonas pyrrhocoris TaxID=157538 RepID=A0A0N0VDT9_LEPPY|nr:hypothetical protein ABB37_08130 [Leptomonas pyrrhocoris]KPA75974.1 hypothetical protein ABB37_08130 [Leptomonas pyrrhocoris]|eukprot:XP_015654413.1 hypothetical protein ABB37_08130 [Leptomonas pyrrhocoris]